MKSLHLFKEFIGQPVHVVHTATDGRGRLTQTHTVAAQDQTLTKLAAIATAQKMNVRVLFSAAAREKIYRMDRVTAVIRPASEGQGWSIAEIVFG